MSPHVDSLFSNATRLSFFCCSGVGGEEAGGGGVQLGGGRGGAAGVQAAARPRPGGHVHQHLPPHAARQEAGTPRLNTWYRREASSDFERHAAVVCLGTVCLVCIMDTSVHIYLPSQSWTLFWCGVLHM